MLAVLSLFVLFSSVDELQHQTVQFPIVGITVFQTGNMKYCVDILIFFYFLLNHHPAQTRFEHFKQSRDLLK